MLRSARASCWKQSGTKTSSGRWTKTSLTSSTTMTRRSPAKPLNNQPASIQITSPTSTRSCKTKTSNWRVRTWSSRSRSSSWQPKWSGKSTSWKMTGSLAPALKIHSMCNLSRIWSRWSRRTLSCSNRRTSLRVKSVNYRTKSGTKLIRESPCTNLQRTMTIPVRRPGRPRLMLTSRRLLMRCGRM